MRAFSLGHILALLLPVLVLVRAQSPCCDILKGYLGEIVVDVSSNEYDTSIRSYFSGQEADLKPGCFLLPRNARHVSEAISLLHDQFNEDERACKVAIRGAGNTPYSSAANVDQGVTIDLGRMNNVTVSENHAIVSVGGGASWDDVYAILDPMGLVTTGGRLGRVGVGGLTLGGGFSFFMNREGFVCDNVVRYEVVLANGTIAMVEGNSELGVALRGGSNNFGIVTRFDFATYSNTKIWGGDVIYSIGTQEAQIKALTKHTSDPEYDPLATMYMLFIYLQGELVISNNLVYTENRAYPATFQQFYDIQPQYFSFLRSTSMSEMVASSMVDQQVNLRHAFLTTTWLNDLDASTTAVNIFKEHLQNLEDIEGLVYYLDLQPVTSRAMEQSARKGGNSLGLNPDDGPLIVALLSGTWSNASDDEQVLENMMAVLQDIETATKETGKYCDWKYLNYAHEGQAVMSGYGGEISDQLRRVSRKVDPDSFFQKAVSGSFKIF